MSNLSAAPQPGALRAPSALPLGGLALLLVLEAVSVTLCFDTAVLLQEQGWWASALGYAGDFLRVGIAAGAAMVLVGGRRLWEGLIQDSSRAGAPSCRWSYLVGHLGAYGLFFWVTAVLLGGQIGAWGSPLSWVALWLLLGAITVILLALAAAPMDAWLQMTTQMGPALLAGALVGLGAWLAGLATQVLWRPLAEGTFWLVHALLCLVRGDISCQSAERVVGTSTFAVTIAPECSGYEGIGLVVVFLSAYLWLFRRDLSFPRCLALLPLGVVLIWLSNAVRIALLVLIGSAGWREIALGGFHSQAGWLMFLAISLGLVGVSARRALPVQDARRGALRRDPTAAYLSPFLALVAVSMLTAAVAGKGEQLYPLRLVAALAALWLFRAVYQNLRPTWSWHAAALGVVAFAAWLLLTGWLQGSPEPSAGPTGLGLGIRIIGYLLVAPVVEELAFRGYLLRRFHAVDFLEVKKEQISWLAMAGSSVLFGAMHGGQWLAGTAAGMLFALAFCRRCRVGDSVVAHAVTNGLLAVYAIVTGNWWAWS